MEKMNLTGSVTRYDLSENAFQLSKAFYSMADSAYPLNCCSPGKGWNHKDSKDLKA